MLTILKSLGKADFIHRKLKTSAVEAVSLLPTYPILQNGLEARDKLQICICDFIYKRPNLCKAQKIRQAMVANAGMRIQTSLPNRAGPTQN